MKSDCPHCGDRTWLSSSEWDELSAIPLSIRCNHCLKYFDPVPAKNEKIEPQSKEATSRDLPWYKDPILRWAWILPAVILGPFLCYLAWESNRSHHRQTIAAMGKEAEQLAAKNENKAAYEKYQALLAHVGGSDPGSDELRDIVEVARSESDRLQTVIEQIERDKERDKQLADQKSALQAEYRRLSEDSRRFLEESNRSHGSMVDERVNQHPNIITDSIAGSQSYARDVSAVKRAVLADTIAPESAQFCPRFEVIRNKRGNKTYVGWYRSKGLNGVEGQDNIIAEVNNDGDILKLSIGAY